jgi:hypothetical protein
MGAGVLVMMMTPAQGNLLPTGADYACDNGKYGKGWPGAEKWFTWLTATVERYGAERCIFATAPDVPFDGEATYHESLPWLPLIRGLGVPAAYVEQGTGPPPPWDEFDCLFLGGTTEWKTGPEAARLAREAKAKGKTVHMGRVNSRKRLVIAMDMGCDTADGTFLVFGPNKNWPRLRHWIAQGHQTWIGMDQAS